MNANQLIQELQKMPQDAEVEVVQPGPRFASCGSRKTAPSFFADLVDGPRGRGTRMTFNPCPFCRSKNAVCTGASAAYVECADCLARGPLVRDTDAAVSRWNRVRGSNAPRDVAIRAKDACYAALQHEKWMTSEGLVSVLPRKGIRLEVKNPQQRLAQMLGSDQRFRNKRSKGWSLVEYSND
jgi:hypothetical protein